MKNSILNVDIVKYIKNGRSEKFFSLSGRPFGKEQRKKHNLANIENDYDKIIVSIPDNILYMSSSFFLGMLGASVRKCQTAEAFKNKYEFIHNGKLEQNIEEGINDALEYEGILD